MTLENDEGVLKTLLDRFTNQRLPRALELQKRVNEGATLTEYDIVFLEQVFADSKNMATLIDRHPEYQTLVNKAANLYHKITAKALENEKQLPG